MANFTVAPINRLEGHLDIDVTTDGTNTVTAIDNKVVMFRGLENVAMKRDPRDMPIIAPRT
jgi:Ni,Fe-hydrogenase I large subunit